jgi:hypothetical protein
MSPARLLRPPVTPALAGVAVGQHDGFVYVVGRSPDKALIVVRVYVFQSIG